jgi:hypothetical protein
MGLNHPTGAWRYSLTNEQKTGGTMNVYYFDQTADPTSLPLEELLAALRAKDIEHDARQIVADLDIKGWHSHRGVSTSFSIVRSF